MQTIKNYFETIMVRKNYWQKLSKVKYKKE